MSDAPILVFSVGYDGTGLIVSVLTSPPSTLDANQALQPDLTWLAYDPNDVTPRAGIDQVVDGAIVTS